MGSATNHETWAGERPDMPECPDCGAELEVSEAPTDERGRHKVYECNGCNELFEIDEITEQ